MFDILFSLNSDVSAWIGFEINKAMNTVAFGETIGDAATVFIQSSQKVVRDAYIDRATRTAGENI